ncbi:MAG: tryptophan 7-halogenase, partial [Elusimicrobia bacterium]|nr:tryptophan 7-halogenase [Elusimicrobiota bacterium]
MSSAVPGKKEASWDCVIAGGGPAGATLASILLRHRPETRIVILEKERFPRFHVGETLVSEINRILHEMGAYEKVAREGFVRKYGATFRWGANPQPWNMLFGEMESLRPLEERFGSVQTAYTWHVDRAKYDRCLLDHAASLGAAVLEGVSAVSLIEENGRTAGVRGGDGKDYRGRFVVDATGQAGFAAGLSERELDPRLKHVAYWGYFRGFKMDSRYTGAIGSSRAFIAAHPNGWSWFFPIRPDLASVGVVTDFQSHRAGPKGDPEAFYRSALASCPELSGLLRGAELVPYEKGSVLVHSLRDFSYLSRTLTRPGFARVGDAAGFVDPILSVGCFLGQFFGRMLAYGLLTLLDGRSGLEEGAVFEAYADHFRDALAAYREMTYFFYRFNERPEAWWAKARALVQDADFPRAAADRQAFNVFVTGLAARRSLFRAPTAVFDAPFFQEAARQWIAPDG